MSKESKAKNKNNLEPRRKPLQQRGVDKAQNILDVTLELLDEVGIDDLTTILIAKRLGISVGSLYHYFPNKHSILHALGDRWLTEMTQAMNELEKFDFASLDLLEFVEKSVDRVLLVYKNQQAMLPLTQALQSIPELRKLDTEHDELVITKMMGIFKKLGFTSTNNELNRLGRAYLELTHALFIVIVEQKNVRARRTLNDLKRVVFTLLEPHQKDSPNITRNVEKP